MFIFFQRRLYKCNINLQIKKNCDQEVSISWLYKELKQKVMINDGSVWNEVLYFDYHKISVIVAMYWLFIHSYIFHCCELQIEKKKLSNLPIF